jgi:hypothetical protein
MTLKLAAAAKFQLWQKLDNFLASKETSVICSLTNSANIISIFQSSFHFELLVMGVQTVE